MAKKTQTGQIASIVAILIALVALFGQYYPNLTFKDEKPPLVGILSPTSHDIVSEKVMIRALIYDSSNYSISIHLNGSIIGTEIPWEWNSSTLDNGHYLLSIFVTDIFNNTGSDSVVFDVLNNKSCDSDHDGLSDIEEMELGTNPLLFDTDIDNFHDGFEILMETDPLNQTDYPQLNLETYHQILSYLEGNHTLLMNLYNWMDGNATQLENLAHWAMNNATKLQEMSNWLTQNATIISELITSTSGNFSLIEQLSNYLEYNSTLLESLWTWVDNNATLLSQLIQWNAYNASLIEDLLLWTHGNATLLGEVITNASLSDHEISTWYNVYSGALSDGDIGGSVWYNATELEINFTLNTTSVIYFNFHSGRVILYPDHYMRVRFLLDGIPIANPSSYVKSFGDAAYECITLQHLVSNVTAGNHSLMIQYDADYDLNAMTENSLFILAFSKPQHL